jgi:hypothetical protein
VQISIDDIKVTRDKNHSTQIKIDDNLMMEMKYPSLDQFVKSNFEFSNDNQVDQSFELIASCIDKVYSADEAWTTDDFTKKEVTEFLEQMNSAQFKEIESFFSTMPKLSHEVQVVNPKTKKKSNFSLIQFHKYSLTEIENMMPWERDVYVELLRSHLEEEKLKMQQQQG